MLSLWYDNFLNSVCSFFQKIAGSCQLQTGKTGKKCLEPDQYEEKLVKVCEGREKKRR